MKKLFAFLMMLTFLTTNFAFAENTSIDLSNYSYEELIQLSEAIKQALSTFEPEPVYESLTKGSKGESVVTLQKRLAELNYLQSRADGDYGNVTAEAVKLFQKTVGLEITGTADPDTQKALYAEDAPIAKVYVALDFKGISRDPENHKGKLYKFSGKVLQVLEEKMDSFTYVCMRIATKGNYDDVVYVTYLRNNNEARILEDDRVTVYATCLGLHTYETVIGGTVTLPNFLADTVSFN